MEVRHERSGFRVVRRAVLIALCLLLAACGSMSVVDDLTQAQANEIVAVLHSQGIRAETAKAAGSRGHYSVVVRREDFSAAVALIHEKNLPSESRPGLTDLLAQKGLVPNSREIEALRVERAFAAEIEETLQTNPGVVQSRVVVRSGAGTTPGMEPADKGVVVTILTHPPASVKSEDITEVVLRAVPGVKRENIFVSIHQQSEQGNEQAERQGVARVDGKRVVHLPLTPFLWKWQVPEDQYNGMALGFLGVIVLIFVLGGVVGFGAASIRHAQRSEQEFQGPGPAAPRLGLGRLDRGNGEQF